MEYLADSHTMKTVDNCSIQEFKIPSVVLMERAALGVSVFLKGLITREKSNKCIKTVCVCGSGNNGADGLAVARQLNENGINVSVVIAGTSEGTEEYRLQKNIVSNLGIECVEYNGNIDFSEYDYIIDAIFGIGLSRAVVVYLDNYDKAYKTWDAKEIADILGKNGEFTFDVSGNSTRAHKMKVVCTDAAGNKITKEIKDFYVTTNLFIRYYNNKLLFFGSIAGFLLIIGVIVYAIVRKKKAK